MIPPNTARYPDLSARSRGFHLRSTFSPRLGQPGVARAWFRVRELLCICPDRWAAENGDASALDDATDKLNCDEFGFASSCNSGGMKKSEGGLNESVPTGSTTGIPDRSARVQSFAKKHGTKVHLYNIDNGKVPTFHEVCGRSSISGIHNPGVDGRELHQLHEADARIMDKDAYWLNTRMTGSCAATDAFGKPVSPVICTMVGFLHRRRSSRVPNRTPPRSG
ncbi:hypothetical protein OHT93_00490 [Streptomyces sp. NBC_00191]|uniref:hypothetical protein n=1 Tax=Streptomyces sp. NBC_00191 TaxID=2975674 RepID=UPI003243A9D0